MAAEKHAVMIVPPEVLPQPPYANQTFVMVFNDIDLNVVFMRVPILSDERAKALVADGKTTLEGDVVGSITLSRQVARDLASQLTRSLNGTEKAGGG